MEDDIVLLLQLIRSLENCSNDLEKAYNNSDKEKFDNSRASIIDLQNKIDFILKKNVS